MFSDGIGKLSHRRAAEMAKSLGLEYVPSAFQIRYAGCKGMVAVDPELLEMEICVRPSMKKFDSERGTMDVLLHAAPVPCFLNRQVIMLLSGLGVPDRVFMEMQDETLMRAAHVLVDFKEAFGEIVTSYDFRVPKASLEPCRSLLMSDPYFRLAILTGG